jgi:hypothetical protein
MYLEYTSSKLMEKIEKQINSQMNMILMSLQYRPSITQSLFAFQVQNLETLLLFVNFIEFCSHLENLKYQP